MATRHLIEKGQGLSWLCKEYGMSPDRIWNDAANADLRTRRIDGDILLPGDVVVIPDKEIKEEPRSTDARHVFRRLGVPAFIRLQFWMDRKPRADERCVVTVDGVEHWGVTDEHGAFGFYVENKAQRAEARLGEDEELYEIEIGGMDPANETIGVQKRLANLGYYDGEFDGMINEGVHAALRRFQHDSRIEETGQADKATLDRLALLHDTTEMLPEEEAIPEAVGNP